MQVLISGSTGFIGKNLIPYLQQHIPDVRICRLVREKKEVADEYSVSDILAGSTQDIDVIIHLAGLAHDTNNVNDESAYYAVNYELTRSLYDWFLKSSAKKFIYVSSVKAAADSIEGVLFEDIIATPQTPYGKSKLKAEEHIQNAPKDAGKSFYILRPCMVHGPGNKGNLNLFYKFIKKGLPYPLGAFENKRSFLSIENFCFVTNRLLQNEVKSGVYNLADDESLSTNQLFNLISGALGKKPNVWNISASAIKMFARIGDAFRLPVNTERLNKLTENYVVSNDKIKKAIGITSMPVSATQGITTTILSFEGNNN